MHPKRLLADYGLEPKKSLGQNFLFDDGLLARIAASAELTPADAVLEVGAGLGSLTQHLAQAAGRVVAVEIDQRLIPILNARLAHYTNVAVVQGDILTIDLADWFPDPYVAVGNVPYYITGAILRRLLDGSPRPSPLVLTVQKEVADRLTAEPPHMSLLAVSVRYYGSPRLVTVVKAGAFWPRPDVDSAVVRIDVADPATRGVDERAFFRLTRAGFSEKRKQLKNNLAQLGLPPAALEQALAAAGVDGRRRAETLSVEEWVALCKALPGAEVA